MLKLTKKADYGLMALKYLAEHPEKPALSAKMWPTQLWNSRSTARQDFANAYQAGLAPFARRHEWRYALSRDAREISAYEVIHAIDGPFFITSCTRALRTATSHRVAPSKSRWHA